VSNYRQCDRKRCQRRKPTNNLGALHYLSLRRHSGCLAGGAVEMDFCSWSCLIVSAQTLEKEERELAERFAREQAKRRAKREASRTS
jgi:sRNA-binding protein